jgi:hypothetical protein
MDRSGFIFPWILLEPDQRTEPAGEWADWAWVTVHASTEAAQGIFRQGCRSIIDQLQRQVDLKRIGRRESLTGR